MSSEAAGHLRYMLLLREAADRTDCFCGERKGHAGWLVCVDTEHKRREEADHG